MQDLEKNKATVMAFYDMMYNQDKAREAGERYVGETYIQHNPNATDGMEAMIGYFAYLNTKFLNKHLTFRTVLAEGDRVFIHSEQELTPNDGQEKITMSVMDIFRLDETGKIVEHWDTIQQVPAQSEWANKNGMF